MRPACLGRRNWTSWARAMLCRKDFLEVIRMFEERRFPMGEAISGWSRQKSSDDAARVEGEPRWVQQNHDFARLRDVFEMKM